MNLHQFLFLLYSYYSKFVQTRVIQYSRRGEILEYFSHARGIHFLLEPDHNMDSL